LSYLGPSLATKRSKATVLPPALGLVDRVQVLPGLAVDRLGQGTFSTLAVLCGHGRPGRPRSDPRRGRGQDAAEAALVPGLGPDPVQCLPEAQGTVASGEFQVNHEQVAGPPQRQLLVAAPRQQDTPRRILSGDLNHHRGYAASQLIPQLRL
jgi:hypothetical protein